MAALSAANLSRSGPVLHTETRRRPVQPWNFPPELILPSARIAKFVATCPATESFQLIPSVLPGIPIRVRRPLQTRQAHRLRPLKQAPGADAAGIERVPS